MNQEKKLSELDPPTLLEYSIKPNILYIADVPNWSFDIKGHQYKKYLPQFKIDIGYVLNPDPEKKWQNMILSKKYDVIWFQHQQNISYENIVSFISKQNKKRTQVICTINEVLSEAQIKNEIKLLSAYNAISVNNPWVYDNFKRLGFDVYKTYDGVDLNTFGPDKPIQTRDFKVFFSSSLARLEHKGYYLFQDVKKILEKRKDIQFVEIITDSYNNKKTPVEMNEVYNQCQVFVCLSLSEGGPCTFQEAAACGLVPIMTRVGYADYFDNIFVIERNAEECAKKIVYLKENPEILIKKSYGISKEILPWHDKFISQHWGYFVQKVILKSKGIKLP
jgi:Glycosyl transferases group 1